MDPLLLLAGLALAGATALSIVYAHQVLVAPGRVARRRIAPVTPGDLTVRAPLVDVPGTRIPFADRLPLSSEARLRVDSELERAGVPLRASEYLALRLATAIAGGLAGALLVGQLGLATGWLMITALGLIVTGWLLPRFWLSQKRASRLEAIETQLPGALTAIAKSLRAGTGLLQAIDFATTQTPAPLGPEFAITLRQIRLGADPEEAFTALSRRVGSPDLDIAITAIVIQRNVGGNLSEILTNVSRTVTQREQLQREIRILTSRQKLTGNFVAAIPVLVALAFLGLNREMAEQLIGTTAGRISLAIGIAFEIAGIFLIRRLARIEV